MCHCSNLSASAFVVFAVVLTCAGIFSVIGVLHLALVLYWHARQAQSGASGNLVSPWQYGIVGAEFVVAGALVVCAIVLACVARRRRQQRDGDASAATTIDV